MHNANVLFLLLSAAGLFACSSSHSHGAGGAGGAGGGGGGGGGTQPGTCTWTTKTSNATCPIGPCPIMLDEELTCSDTEFGAHRVRVAPAPDATWLATASSRERHVYRLANGARE